MDVQAIEQAGHINGKTSWRELLFLLDLARKAPNGVAVEVGALYGRSVSAWAIGRRGHGEMWVVDDQCREAMVRNLPDGVGYKKGLSWEMADELPDLAFCFIDADHAEEPFGKDLAVYTTKIVPGGIIAFHDYEADRFAVKPLVDAWWDEAQWECLGLVDTLIAFRRPE